MARQPRFIVPGVAHHIIQRGNNRCDTFRSLRDFHFYQDCLLEALFEFKVQMHAYVLMTNHVHLLMTPSTEDGISQTMQAVGRRYVSNFNRSHARTGGLWDGRFRSILIDTERYLFTCMRYIELNPVRAGLVAQPKEYRWSSFHANVSGNVDQLVTPHQRYLEISKDPVRRRAGYALMFADSFTDEDLTALRK